MERKTKVVSTRVTNQFWLRLAGVQENLFPHAIQQQHHFHQDSLWWTTRLHRSTISCLCSERQTPLETIKDSVQHLCLLSFGQTISQLTESFWFLHESEKSASSFPRKIFPQQLIVKHQTIPFSYSTWLLLLALSLPIIYHKMPWSLCWRQSNRRKTPISWRFALW